jgi:hypothetical protein
MAVTQHQPISARPIWIFGVVVHYSTKKQARKYVCHSQRPSAMPATSVLKHSQNILANIVGFELKVSIV